MIREIFSQNGIASGSSARSGQRVALRKEFRVSNNVLGESMSEDPAVEISTELTFDEGRIAISRAPSVCEEGLQVLADDRVQDGGLGLAAAVGAGERGRCGAR
jgi:hypothetical protein